MPKSRNRKQETFTPPPMKRRGGGMGNKRWVAPLMIACFAIGLLWIVVYYIAGTDVPGMTTLGNWNLLIGMGLIAVGFVISTQWK